MFIVIEGMDYAGKSTLAKALKEGLEKGTSKEVVILSNPGGDDEMGKALRELFKSPIYREPEVDFALLLANRLHLSFRIKTLMEEGKIVIVDRWDLSADVYQNTARCGLFKDKFYYYSLPLWQRGMEMPFPNYVIYLDPTLEVVKTRALKRQQDGNDHYEDFDLKDDESFKTWYDKLAIGYRRSCSYFVSPFNHIERLQEWSNAVKPSFYQCSKSILYGVTPAQFFVHVPVTDADVSPTLVAERIFDLWESEPIITTPVGEEVAKNEALELAVVEYKENLITKGIK